MSGDRRIVPARNRYDAGRKGPFLDVATVPCQNPAVQTLPAFCDTNRQGARTP